MDALPFELKVVNGILPEAAAWIKENITVINQRVYGEKGMPTEPWIDQNFGITAGFTAGFLHRGEVVSMVRACGSLDPGTVHIWTLMVTPAYRKLGLGKATLALACMLCSHMSKLTFITQVEDEAIPVYLHLSNSGGKLKVIGAGFHHTHMPNSIACEASMPESPLETLMSRYDMPPLEDAVEISRAQELKAGSRLLVSSSHKDVVKLAEHASTRTLALVGWYRRSSPVIMVEVS
ncbi:MAG: hypothetical protein DRN96_05840 [Thermoproteota archaeon]|nr:MAG: hypothetical protein DRN96_05840 [Candidatus Korarchaeota archaeon]